MIATMASRTGKPEAPPEWAGWTEAQWAAIDARIAAQIEAVRSRHEADAPEGDGMSPNYPRAAEYHASEAKRTGVAGPLFDQEKAKADAKATKAASARLKAQRPN
jgi:hypothetical protein